MAIQKSVRIHPSSEVGEIKAAYIVIDRIEHQRLVGAVTLGMVCFASRDDRETLRQAAKDGAEAAPIIAAGDRVNELTYPEKPSDEQIQAVDRQRLEASRAFEDAQLKLAAAQRAAQGIQPIGPIGMAPVLVVPAADVAALLVNGSPDMAACYAWLMKQPGYDGEAV